MIEFLPLTEHIRQAERLYLNSFPEEERRAWQDILIKTSEDYFDFSEIRNKDTFLGIISVWRFSEFAYVEHFAVEPHLRNQGWGSAVLNQLHTRYNLPIVLEVEPPIDAIAYKRIAFYKKNGFHMLDEVYIQPPYKNGLPEVEMRIMTTDKEDIPFETIKQTLYRNVYSVY